MHQDNNKPKSKYARGSGTPNPIDVHVGKRLATLRSLAGLSQEALSENVDVTFQQIQKYEKGTNRIAASRLYEFSCLFDVSVAAFFEGLNRKKLTTIKQPVKLAPFIWNDYFLRLTPDHREIATSTILTCLKTASKTK